MCTAGTDRIFDLQTNELEDMNIEEDYGAKVGHCNLGSSACEADGISG